MRDREHLLAAPFELQIEAASLRPRSRRGSGLHSMRVRRVTAVETFDSRVPRTLRPMRGSSSAPAPRALLAAHFEDVRVVGARSRCESVRCPPARA